MRILVGNHIDSSIQARKDMRSWTQRVLWFARDGDCVILPGRVDEEFLSYVTGLTGVDPDSLKIHVPPPGESGDHLLETRRLMDEGFLRAVAADLSEVTEIEPLWPSSALAGFAEALGLADRLPGGRFLSQSGGELVNNKAYFRVLAAAAGVPTAPGGVAHSVAEAVDLMTALLRCSNAVMVKQAHNGAGGGNQIVLAGDDIETGHAGAKHVHRLGSGEDAIAAYWHERWAWASAGDRFPVVVERFQPRSSTIFSEHHLEDSGTRPTETGSLGFVDRWLSEQVVPLRTVDDDVRARLVDGGTRLAETYRAVGHRGYISADAVIDDAGELIFTEVNARVSGTTHVYEPIAHRIVDVWRAPERTIVDFHWPKREWRLAGFAEFLDACTDLGCAYDPVDRIGVIVTTPFDDLRGLSFCVVHDIDETRDAIRRKLDERFRREPRPIDG
jgi:hypothetical protein